jgi:hypothetical protein
MARMPTSLDDVIARADCSRLQALSHIVAQPVTEPATATAAKAFTSDFFIVSYVMVFPFTR